MAKKSSSSSKTNTKSLKAAVTTAVGLAAGFAVTVAGVACLTAFYCKSLMGVDYQIEENEDGDEE